MDKNLTIKYKGHIRYVADSYSHKFNQKATLLTDYNDDTIINENGKTEFKEPKYYSYGYLKNGTSLGTKRGWVLNLPKKGMSVEMDYHSQKTEEINDLYWVFEGREFPFPEAAIIKTKKFTEKLKEEFDLGNFVYGYGKKYYITFDGDNSAIDMQYDLSIEKSKKYYAVYFGDEKNGLFEKGLITHSLPNAYLYARQFDVNQATLLIIENGNYVEDVIYPFSDDLQEVANNWLQEYYNKKGTMETTKEKIAKLEKAIASPATPANIKMSMENALYDLKEKLAEEMSPTFTDYKGEQIMFEPTNGEYFVVGNDENIFKSMEEAKNFIDNPKGVINTEFSKMASAETKDDDVIEKTLNLIKEQTGLTLKLNTHFSGLKTHNKEKYFNVDLDERVSESNDFNTLKRFADKYNLIKVEPNGLNMVAIYPKVNTENEEGKKEFTFLKNNPKVQARALTSLSKKFMRDGKVMTGYEIIESLPKGLEIKVIKLHSNKSEKGFTEKTVIGDFISESKAEVDYYNYLGEGGYAYSDFLKESERLKKIQDEKRKEEQEKASAEKEAQDRAVFAREKQRKLDHIKYILNGGDTTIGERQLDLLKRIYHIKNGELVKSNDWKIGDDVYVLSDKDSDTEILTKIIDIKEGSSYLDNEPRYVVEKNSNEIYNVYKVYDTLFPAKTKEDIIEKKESLNILDRINKLSPEQKKLKIVIINKSMGGFMDSPITFYKDGNFYKGKTTEISKEIESRSGDKPTKEEIDSAIDALENKSGLNKDNLFNIRVSKSYGRFVIKADLVIKPKRISLEEAQEEVDIMYSNERQEELKRFKEELKKGIEVEQEHKDTLEGVAAGEITVPQAIEETAKTHIEENPKYYDELEKIEGGDKVEAAMQVQFDLIKEELAKGKDKSKHVLSVASMQIIKMLKENPSLYPFYVEKYLDLPKSVRDDLNPFSEQFGGIESPIMKWLKEQNKNVFDVVKVEEYSLPKTKVIQTKPDDKNFMDIHSDFIGSDNLRPVMMGTHFDENGIVSTNAHIMLITPYRGDSDKLEGNFCHTKKCIEEWKSKEIPSKTGEFQNKFPNWKVVIPLSNTEYNMNTAAVYDFIKNATTYELMNTVTNTLAFKYGEEKIGFNSNFMLTCIQAMSELGHKELSIAISSSSRAALIIPKGRLQDVNNIKTDFALLMPMKIDDGVEYFGEFNFETSCYTDPNELTYCFDVEKVKIKKAEKRVKQLEKKIEELTSAIEPIIKEKEFPSPVGYGTFKVVKGIFEGTEFFGRVDGDRVINEDSLGQSFPIENVKRIGYELGEGWSADFDLEGLLRTALKANTSWGVEALKKLHYSFEDNNYHTIGKPLWEAVKSLQLGAEPSAKLHLHEFHEAVQKELDEYLSPDEEGVEIDPNTLQPVKNLHKVNTSEYPKVQLKGDNRAFWYVVRSEGDKYILVFEEKIDDWKSASNIERYEYYEEIGNKEDYEPYTQVQTEEDDKASWEELKELAEAMISVTKGKEKKEWIEAKELAEAMLEV